MHSERELTVYYDGICNMCSRMVRFVSRWDAHNSIVFLPLQQCEYPDAEKLNSIVVHQGAQWYVKSEAVFRILRSIGGIWRLSMVFRVIPVSWRDAIYDWIARNRYRWFGKTTVCHLKNR